MKKTLLTMAAALCFTSAFAADVTYSMNDVKADQIVGEGHETTYKEDGSVKAYANWQPLEKITLGDYVLTFDQGTAATAPAFYTAKEGSAWTVRCYNGGSMTVTSTSDLKGIILSSDKPDAYIGSASTGVLNSFNKDGKSYTWAAPADCKSVTFSFTGTFRITAVTFTENTPEVTTPETPATNGLLDVTFSTTNTGGFTLEQGTLPEGLSYVWAFDDKYGLKATAYNQKVFVSDAWAISPVVDLTSAEKAILNFSQAANNFKLNGTNVAIEEALKFISVNIREEGGEWTALTVPNQISALSWNFVESGDIDLSAYKGKKIQIGFHYTSSADVAGTWEIKYVKISGEGGSVVTPPTPPTVDEYPISVNDATEIDGTPVEEQAPSASNQYGTAAHYQPLTSFVIGDYYFTFSSTSDKDNQQPALYLPMSTSTTGNKNVRLYSGSSMTIQAPADKKMFSIAADGSNADSGLEITADSGTVTLDGAKMSWTNKEGVNKVTFTANKKIRFYGFNIDTTASVEGIADDAAIYVLGNTIVAPQGAKVYSLNGVEVKAEGLAAGVYVVVYGNKAVKVLVK
ncbi:MAG: choice-of-anchor J domain-containing protein [Prevotella sp.]|nr:choice-of-anchor J domain-containing protein [Bacteroides sp.]MCM1366794.1 choice-of-anchor J domain-containing protein [Prevotella sp.]MCM1437468.1 choice-of-anchor J domain-containing protein [Prevotella sp.]